MLCICSGSSWSVGHGVIKSHPSRVRDQLDHILVNQYDFLFVLDLGLVCIQLRMSIHFPTV